MVPWAATDALFAVDYDGSNVREMVADEPPDRPRVVQGHQYEVIRQVVRWLGVIERQRQHGTP